MIKNALEQCYESQFETSTWYYKQLSILDLKYSHYIDEILQCKLSIKSKLETEYKQRLQNIDAKIKLLTNINQLKNDDGVTESIKQEVIRIDNQQYNVSDEQSPLSKSMKATHICNSTNELASLQAGTVANIDGYLNNEQQSDSESMVVTQSKPKPKPKLKPKPKTRKKKQNNETKAKRKCAGRENKSKSLKYYTKLMKNGKTQYKCKVCSKVCSSRSSVHSHYTQKHTTRFQCNFDDCNRCFACDAQLKIHQRSHTNDKPFACKFCDKSFTIKSILTRHVRIHTGEKPYKCQYCQKRFTQSGVRNRHERIHKR